MAPRVQVASLKKMTSTVRDKKAAAPKASLGREAQNSLKNKKFAQGSSTTTSDSDDTSSSDSDSDSASDSDDDLAAARRKLDAKMASKKKASNVKLNGTKPQAESAQKSSKVAAKPPAQSSESDSDSSSESEAEAETKSTSAPANQVATKPSAVESESEDSSSDSEEDENATSKAAAKPHAEAKAQVAADESDSSSSSSSSSSSESDSDEQDEAAINGDTTAVARVNGDTSGSGPGGQVARPNWLNNSDFTLRKASSDNPGKEVTDFFNKTNLEGKQVWYFTAPASLPITVLKEMEIDLAKATAGHAILNHQGDSYGLDLEAHATSTQIQLLIPSKGGEKYNTLNHGIDSTVHLRRMAKFGPGGAISSTASEQYAPQPKTIREQPEGLRARFTPLGVPVPPAAQPTSTFGNAQKPVKPAVRIAESSSSDSKSDSDSDEEMTDAAAPTSSTPSKKSTAPAVANSKLKRKQPEDEQKPQSSPAKDKKATEQAPKRQKSSKSSASGITKVEFEKTPSASKSKTAASSQAPKLTNAKKETPIAAPNIAQLASGTATSGGTPSKSASSSKSKDKSDKKAKKSKESTTESPALPVKQTPIPLPKFPGMKT